MTTANPPQSNPEVERDPIERSSHDPLAAEEERLLRLSLEELDAELPSLCARATQHVDTLSQWFVERREVIEVAMICATLGEPLLLLGPPGTAKSQLCARFAESLDLDASQRFEYLLTPFTEPSELFGPIDLNALRDGRFLRRHEGSLSHVKVAFLDEIFRANSAILNALLSLLNDRTYYEEGRAKRASLSVIFAAANELPTDARLNALSDRFTLKVPVKSVHHTHWDALLTAGLTAEAHATEGVKPWAHGPVSYLDLLKLRRYLQLSYAREASDPALRDYVFPPEVMAKWRHILTSLELDLGLYISDRKVVRLYRILRGAALLKGRHSVSLEDLKLLRFLAQRPGEHDLIADRVERILST